MKYKTFKHIYYISQKANLLSFKMGMFDVLQAEELAASFRRLTTKNQAAAAVSQREKDKRNFRRNVFRPLLQIPRSEWKLTTGEICQTIQLENAKIRSLEISKN